jgi:hypothetical protein
MEVLILAFSLIVLASILALPVLHVIGFIRHYRLTLRATDLYFRAAFQAVAIILIQYIAVFIGFLLSVMLLGAVLQEYTLYLFPIIYVGSTAFMIMAAHVKEPSLPLAYGITRIPVDLTLQAALDASMKPALFASRRDSLLFESAVDWWKQSGRDEAVIKDAELSSEARGRIIGAYLDTAPSSFFIARIKDSVDRYMPVVCNPRVIIPTALLLLAAIFGLLLRNHFHEFEISDATRIARLTLNFVFGALYTSDENLRMLAQWAIVISFGSAVYPDTNARWAFTASIIAYALLSLFSLPLAYEQWSNMLVLQISSWAEWGIDTGLNAATGGAWGTAKAVLTFSLTNFFGLSLVLWPLYILRLLQLTWSADGHLFYDNAVSRPESFGGIRPNE